MAMPRGHTGSCRPDGLSGSCSAVKSKNRPVAGYSGLHPTCFDFKLSRRRVPVSPMPRPQTPDELKQFLLAHVEDLAELEVLAWFHRESEGTWVAEADLLAAMPFPADTTSAALERLVTRV